jgi:hypothetical protein
MWTKKQLDSPWAGQIRIGYEFTMSETGLTIGEESGFTRIALEGGTESSPPGYPLVPHLVVQIAVPDGARVVGVKPMQAVSERIAGDHVVMPAQLPGLALERLRPDELRLRPPQLMERFDQIRQLRLPEPDRLRLPFQMPDLVAYRIRGYFPASLAEVATERNLGPYRILTVRVNPIQFRPRDSAIWVHRSFTLAIDLQPEARLPSAAHWSAEQLERWYELASSLVLNPEDLTLPARYQAPVGETPYLILTNRAMQPEFDRLAEWKTQSGLAARVVTVEDVLGKVYGDFSMGAGGAARDTQEVIRNFLKWAAVRWRVCYLLLGGDTDVIPVRQVASLSHYNWYTKETAAKPEENRCVYDAARKQANIRMKDPLAAATPLLAITSGRRIPYNESASATSPGWYWATSETYAVRSPVPTRFVVLKGPAVLIDDAAGFYRVEAAHSIPTDLYYASLFAPQYGRRDRHDWDLRNTGLYGYYNESGEPSGIDFIPDLCVGRIPCSGTAQAKAVVDKLIRYERYEGISDAAARRALFAADYWFGPTLVGQAPTTATAPGENQFALANATTCRIVLKEVPGTAVDLIAEDGPASFRKLPFRPDASPERPGWYFAEGPSTLSPARLRILTFDLPYPTRYIMVRGPAGTLAPVWYWVDNAGPDLALQEKEQVRSLFRVRAPRVSHHRRLHRDFASIPAAAPGETVGTAMLTAPDLVRAFNQGTLFCSLSGHSRSDREGTNRAPRPAGNPNEADVDSCRGWKNLVT